MKETVLQGIAGSPGIAHGRALLHLQKDLDVPEYSITPDEVEAEIERIDKAMLETRHEISKIRNKIAASLGEGEAAIFDAHLLVLEDVALTEEVISEIRTGLKNAESCYEKVAQRFIAFFSSMEDEFLKERVTDIKDVSRRMLHNLMGLRRERIGTDSVDRVVVSEDLTPSDTADLDRGQLLAFVTDWGGRTSHSVIMARSMGIPAIVGTHDATGKIANGDDLLVDGYEGLVIVNPSQDTLFRYGKFVTERKKLDEEFDTAIGKASKTRDGHEVALMANIEGVEDMENALSKGADGIGLFRTESLFLRHHGYPPESVQYTEYAAVAKAAGDQPVIIRTLDLGGDKRLHDESSTHEDNPFMGFRAIRFCLQNPGIFKTQLRAILRASAHGNVRLMYPMISGISELRRANELLEAAREELRKEGTEFDESMEVGSMVEIPSTATIIDIIAAESDFLSIGTNDLIQYLLAVDRTNDSIAHLFEPTHPAVIRTLKAIMDGGRKAGVHVSICGEIAGDPIFVGLLIGLGANSLSMTSAMLPEVKYYLRSISMKDARRLADEALKVSDAAESMQLLREFRHRNFGKILRSPEIA